MRRPPSPAAKLVAGIGALLSIATSQYEIRPSVSDTEELGEISLGSAELFYLSGSATVNDAAWESSGEEFTIELAIEGRNPGPGSVELRLWRVEDWPESGEIPDGAVRIDAQIVRTGDERDLYVLAHTLHSQDVAVAYLVEVAGNGALEGDLEVSAWIQLHTEHNEEADIEIAIEEAEVIPAADEEEADTATP